MTVEQSNDSLISSTSNRPHFIFMLFTMCIIACEARVQVYRILVQRRFSLDTLTVHALIITNIVLLASLLAVYGIIRLVQIVNFVFSFNLGGVLSLKHRFWVSYKVVIFILGVAIGWFDKNFTQFQSFMNIDFMTSTQMSRMHTVFIPSLVMYRAYSMETQAMRSTSPLVLLALIGVYVLWLIMQSLYFKYVLFLYQDRGVIDPQRQFKIETHVYFGALLSMTDFRIAVRAFRKLGQFSSLVKLMDIDSFMGVVCSITVMHIIYHVNHNPEFSKPLHIVLFIFGQIVIAPLLGYCMAKIAIYWIKHLYGDVISEVTVALTFSYLTYYISNVFLRTVPVNSMISVIVYGIIINEEHDNFSRGIDEFFKQFLKIIEFIMIVFIYTQAGYIVHKNYYKIPAPVYSAFWVSFSLYGFSLISRAIAVILMLPVLRIDMGKKWWNEAAALVLCDHSHPIAILYASIQYIDDMNDPYHTKGGGGDFSIVVFVITMEMTKLLFNGTLQKVILILLGMKRMSFARHSSLSIALRFLSDSINKLIKKFKSDRFLADADWDVVNDLVNFDNEYGVRPESYQSNILDSAMSPEQSIDPEEGRKLQIMYAKRVSFLRQYEQGHLSLEAVRVLLNTIEKLNTSVKAHNTEELLSSESVEKHWDVTFLQKIFQPRWAIMGYLNKKNAHTREMIEKERHRLVVLYYKLLMHNRTNVVFDLVLIVSSVSSLMVIIYQYKCILSWNFVAMSVLYHEVNIGIVSFATLITVSKVLFTRVLDMTAAWNIFWLCVFIFGWIDIILHEIYHAKLADECINTSMVFTPVIYCCRVLEFLRLIRWLYFLERLAFLYVLYANNKILNKLRAGYDVGKGFINAEDEVLTAFADFGDVKHTEKIKSILYEKKATTMRELGALQKRVPGISVSVKTQHAGRRILSSVEDCAVSMRKEGFLDEGEVDMIRRIIDHRVKKLLDIPVVVRLPPKLEIIKHLPYVVDDELAEFLTYDLEVVNFSEGELIPKIHDGYQGIFILISGLIKKEIQSTTSTTYPRPMDWSKSLVSRSSEGSSEEEVAQLIKVLDHVPGGMSIGELQFLSGLKISANYEFSCETANVTRDAAVSQELCKLPAFHGSNWENCELCCAAANPTGGRGEVDDKFVCISVINMEVNFVMDSIVGSAVYIVLCISISSLMHIPFETLLIAREVFFDTNFEELMWRRAALRGAYMLLRTAPVYNTMVYEDFLSAVDSGIFHKNDLSVPFGSDQYPTESLCLEQYDDWHVLLLAGVCKTEGGQMFSAHCIIPSHYDTIHFSSVDCDSYCVYCVRPIPRARLEATTGYEQTGLRLPAEDGIPSLNVFHHLSHTTHSLQYAPSAAMHQMRHRESIDESGGNVYVTVHTAEQQGSDKYIGGRPTHHHRHLDVIEVHDHVTKSTPRVSIKTGPTTATDKKTSTKVSSPESTP